MKLLWCFTVVFFLSGLFSFTAKAQISSTTPAARCGVGTVILKSVGNGTIKWYNLPFGGTALATGETFKTPELEITTTYYVDAEANGCSLNVSGGVNIGRIPVKATIKEIATQANISYSSSSFCKSTSAEQAVIQTGTMGGTYSANPSGLSINASTGAITPSTSLVGDYEITYTVVPDEGCDEVPAVTQISIIGVAASPQISYSGSPFCTTAGAVNVVQTGASGGTYIASPSGLAINSTNGTITPASSNAGTYTINYVVDGVGGCTPLTASTSITITSLPEISISFAGSPFCKSISTAQPVILNGSGAFSGGTYSFTGTGSLSLNTSTGEITPSLSDAGTYVVKYTTLATAGCAVVSANANVIINPLPTASLTGTTSACVDGVLPTITFNGANGTPPYTFTYNVNGGINQTISSLGSNLSVTVAQSTVSAGSFVYNLLSVADANNCSQTVSSQATVTVNTPAIATFNYAGSPFCKTGTVLPVFTGGGSAGVFSSTAGLVFVNTATGEINLSSSTSGDYIITNTKSGCAGDVSSSFTIKINPPLPTANISGTLTSCSSTILTASTSSPLPLYTWYKDNVVIGGQANSTLLVTASGSYKVKVTDSDTGCENTSTASSVTINPNPTVSITGTLDNCVSTTLTAVTSASSPAFVWYKDNVVIAGQVASSLIVTQTGSYKVKVTNGITGCNTTSSASDVTIYPNTVAGSVTGGRTVCSGVNSSLLVLGSYTGDIVRWEYATSTGGPWTAISNVVPAYATTNLTQTTYYRGVLKSPTCGELASAYATVTVVSDPTLSQPANVSFCKGGSTTLSTSASGGTGTFAYQWVYSTTSGGSYSNVVNGTPSGITYSGNTSNSLTVTGNGTESSQGNYYKCILTTLTPTGVGCDATTNAITVTTVDDPSWINYSLPNPTSLCVGGSVAFSVSVTGGLGGNISWIRSNNSTPGAGTEVTVTSGDIPNAGTWYYRPRYTPSGSGCNLADGTQTTVTVLAGPSTPTASTHTADKTQIVWNWNTVSGATGYKWGTDNNYSNASDMATAITKTETSLTCNTPYTRYVWSYNASGCHSDPISLSQTTSSCAVAPDVATKAATNNTGNTATLNATIDLKGNTGTIKYGFMISITANTNWAQQYNNNNYLDCSGTLSGTSLSKDVTISTKGWATYYYNCYVLIGSSLYLGTYDQTFISDNP